MPKPLRTFESVMAQLPHLTRNGLRNVRFTATKQIGYRTFTPEQKAELLHHIALRLAPTPKKKKSPSKPRAKKLDPRVSEAESRLLGSLPPLPPLENRHSFAVVRNRVDRALTPSLLHQTMSYFARSKLSEAERRWLRHFIYAKMQTYSREIRKQAFLYWVDNFRRGYEAVFPSPEELSRAKEFYPI